MIYIIILCVLICLLYLNNYNNIKQLDKFTKLHCNKKYNNCVEKYNSKLIKKHKKLTNNKMYFIKLINKL
mgnify:CR=1 FL=1